MPFYFNSFVIIASDGLWDFLSDDEAVAVVADCIARGDKVATVVVWTALTQRAVHCRLICIALLIFTTLIL